MIRQMDNFDERIVKFYQYLENRLEQENNREKEIIFDEQLKTKKSIYKRKNKQPVPSSI